jgi:hypothetical protein
VKQLAEIPEAILDRIDPDGVVMAPQRDRADATADAQIAPGVPRAD